MSEEPRDAYYGTTLSERIGQYLHQLSSDAIYFAGIVSVGRMRFKLEGAELINFVRKCLNSIVEFGAIPVGGKKGVKYDYWVPLPSYGSTKGEIVENIIKEWLAKGGGNTDLTIWLATPDIYKTEEAS
jgi:hypothetical protein